MFDTHPGGSGQSALARQSLRAILEGSKQIVQSCLCGSGGCPRCIISDDGKCLNYNSMLNKNGAFILLCALNEFLYRDF